MYIISFNLCCMGKIEPKIALLKKLIQDKKPYIICFQEVKKAAYQYIKTQFPDDTLAYSLHYREPGKYDGMNRKLGCLNIFSDNIDVLNSEVVSRSVFPERTISSQINIDGCCLRVLNFHLITGCDYKKAKHANFASIAEYINNSKVDIFCADANEPEIDCLDYSSVKFFRDSKQANWVLGADKKHNLNDCFRTHLANKELVINKVPLAISHYVSRKIPKRYDFIFANEKVIVNDTKYLLEEALAVKSDHAVVMVDAKLRLEPNG